MEKSIYSEQYSVFLGCLREEREKAGITQVQLADRLGERATQSFVSKCERGERRLDIAELRAFCQAIGIPLDDFVRRVEAVLNSKMPTEDTSPQR